MANTNRSSTASAKQLAAEVQPDGAERGQNDDGEPIAGPSHSADFRGDPTDARETRNADETVSFFRKKSEYFET